MVRQKGGKCSQVHSAQERVTMQGKISRRTIVKSGLIAGAFIPAMGLMSNTAAAAGLPPLDPKDPTAQALGYTSDATKGDASGGCNIFAGKSVTAGGWCKVWAQKPGA